MFKVGDRVEVVKKIAYHGIIGVGYKGTVREYDGLFAGIGIEFDKHVGGHDLNGKVGCKYGHGKYLFEPDKELKVLINPYPARTIALMKACQA
jgi:hypothetical protein